MSTQPTEEMAGDATSGAGATKRMPTAVWALGFVSMFMDISSEIIHALLPLYMVSVLGTSVLSVGLIEGIAEGTASIVKVFSGVISDRLGRRKLLAMIGYGLAALTKPVFPLANALEWLVAARFVDRIGKGIRGAPRDALVADVTPPDLRGAAYGLRQTLDTVGAFMGPILAMALMWWSLDDYRFVFWVAVVPAFVAVAVLVVFVREPQAPARTNPRFPLSRREMARLGKSFWLVVATGLVFSLARFSEAFLVLRAPAAGLEPAWVPSVLVVMTIAYSLAAYPAGVLSDRLRRLDVLLVGILFLVAADLVLAFAPGLAGLGMGAILWGLHMGCTQGLFNALIADSAPADLRGTAFGLFNLLTGAMLLVASLIAGALWDAAGYRVTFLSGASFAAMSAIGLLLLQRTRTLPGGAL